MEEADTLSNLEIVTVASGAYSLRSRVHGETFHPVIGPQAEAEMLHAEQHRLLERVAATEGEFVIWDVGLGAAANAVAVLEALRPLPAGQRVALHSFDLDLETLRFALQHAEELGYFGGQAATVQTLLQAGTVEKGGVTWRAHLGDFRQTMEEWPAPHAILYDPYSLASNPTLWCLEHFTHLYERLVPERPCLLTTYSRSTAVRVTLLLAGFYVGLGAAIAEKDETTLAANDPRLLARPLDAAWLGRVRRSASSAPLRVGVRGQPISAEDLRCLEAHPQFVA